MASFSKRSTKALLLLSCSSLIGATLNFPLVHAAEEKNGSSMSSILLDNQIEAEQRLNSLSFKVKLKEEKLTIKELTASEEKESSKEEVESSKGEKAPVETITTLEDWDTFSSILKGTTFPHAFVWIFYENGKELKGEADKDGNFEIQDFSLFDLDHFEVEVRDLEGNVLENLTVSVVENTEEVTQPDSEDPEQQEESPVDPEETEQEEEPAHTEGEEESKDTDHKNQDFDQKDEKSSEEVSAESEIVTEQSKEVSVYSKEQSSSEKSSRATAADKIGTTYYYVKAGDNLKTIAGSFGVKLEDVMRWNGIANANVISIGQIISVNGTNNYKTYNKETVSFTNNKQFLDYVSKYARQIASQYGLYASVMIAQASLETGYGQYSALASKGNNLFGVKAQQGYDGYSIVMRTWEEVNGKKVYIDDYFRLYPSYYESFIDYANKLRNGAGLWDTSFYNGTWMENTNNFRDATLFLTGRYATDSRYYSKLNDIILNNNLTQYDSKGYTDATYTALITQGGQNIGNLPFDHLPSSNANYKNIKVTGNSNSYVGQTVTVKHITRNGTYANIFLNGKELGWISAKALTKTDLSVVNTDFSAYFTSKNGAITSAPVDNSQTGSSNIIGTTGSYLNKKVQVKSQTRDGLQSYITVDGKTLGWVQTKDIGSTVASYEAIIKNGSYEVDTLPWGSSGYQKISTTSAYMGQVLTILARDYSGSYLLASVNGKNVGWIDQRAIQKFSYESVKVQNYITSGSFEIGTLPWGEPGYKKIGNTSEILGKLVTITKVSSNRGYYYVVVDGKEKGWIDNRSFGLKGNAYTAIIKNGSYHVDTLPWGTPGYKKIGMTADHIGKELQIAGSTANGSYLLLRNNGKDVGWIDSRAVKKFESVPVSYDSYITGAKYEIDSLPWGEPGFKKLGETKQILGKVVSITKESPNHAYAWVKADGKDIGWIDKKALGFSTKSYTAVITEGKYEVNTLPWGTPGYKKTGLTSAYFGKKLEIMGSTTNGYLLARLDGKDIGWIDKRSVTPLGVTAINYTKKVTKGNYEINTLPWGTKGYKKAGMTSILVGKNVQAVLESPNKAYVYVLVDGKAVGWIDKRAF